MDFTRRQQVEKCMLQIELVQEAFASVLAAIKLVNRSHYPRHSKVSYGTILEDLCRIELGHWRDLFMFALTVDDKTRDRIKAAAHEKFLANRKDVSRYFEGGPSPMTWLASGEEEFREMARKAFAPREQVANDTEE